ncbi:MAG: hypothetical protein WC346_15090 [Methanogenium sp.]|jgi:hypothetical protein
MHKLYHEIKYLIRKGSPYGDNLMFTSDMIMAKSKAKELHEELNTRICVVEVKERLAWDSDEDS